MDVFKKRITEERKEALNQEKDTFFTEWKEKYHNAETKEAKLALLEEKKKFEEELNKKKDAYIELTKKEYADEKKAKYYERLAQVDLNTLSKPVNDVATSGPKKMKDFSPWAKWKSTTVGIIGIVAVIIIWFIYALVAESRGDTSFISDPVSVVERFIETASNGILWKHMGASFSRILVGYLIAVCTSIPVGFLMAWYKPVRAFFDPFIQFLRCIPPIAYVPIVVAIMGPLEAPKYFIIWLAVFLTMTVTIYQGVKNVDLTLVKAAYTFGARDRNLFTGVIVPSAFPFILTAMRLGVGAAMTTLIAAELTGATYGLGSFINNQASNLRMDYAMMGIILLGIFGIILDKVLLYTEKRLTRWK